MPFSSNGVCDSSFTSRRCCSSSLLGFLLEIHRSSFLFFGVEGQVDVELVISLGRALFFLASSAFFFTSNSRAGIVFLLVES